MFVSINGNTLFDVPNSYILRSNQTGSGLQLTQSSPAAPSSSSVSSVQSTGGYSFDRVLKIWEVRSTFLSVIFSSDADIDTNKR